MQQIIKEIVERITQIVSDAHNLISQLHLVLIQTVTDQSSNRNFSLFNFSNRVFNFLLYGPVEVNFVDRVLRDYRVQ